MKYEDIVKANSTIATTPIKGKQYAEVPQRVKAFRTICPNGTISTEIVSLENGVVVIRATIADEDGKIIATGHAYEKEGSTFINKESYIENCETSAVGRALGFVGLGIDTSICSAEELTNAVINQDQKVDADTIKKLKALAKEKGVPMEMVTARFNKTKVEDMTMKEYVNAVHGLEATKKER